MNDRIHAHLPLLSREESKVLVAEFSPWRPGFDTKGVLEKVVWG
jgi:hypothetical protein